VKAPRRILVRTQDGESYPVVVGRGLIHALPGLLEEHAPAHRYALVGDRRVMELHGGAIRGRLSEMGLQVDAFDFPAGEEHKTLEQWSRLIHALLDAGFGRDACVLALGGGVSGDLAGFVAATYMRGLPVVQLPTSLVAMVDSSVGGKTGVDVPQGKNLVGAFHAPRLVVADPELTGTLPRAERSQGLAEAVKHGAILDSGYLADIESDAAHLLAGDPEPTVRMVARSVEIKAGVVSRDEREGGVREILNFGHTLGHGLEAASDYGLPHGSAVAMGMVLEARLGEELGVTREGTARRLASALQAVELPVEPPAQLDIGRILDHLKVDKKAREGRPRFVLLAETGRVDPPGGGTTSWSRPVSLDRVRNLLSTPWSAAI
jgi:3-dehydroquinate synthase